MYSLKILSITVIAETEVIGQRAWGREWGREWGRVGGGRTETIHCRGVGREGG